MLPCVRTGCLATISPLSLTHLPPCSARSSPRSSPSSFLLPPQRHIRLASSRSIHTYRHIRTARPAAHGRGKGRDLGCDPTQSSSGITRLPARGPSSPGAESTRPLRYHKQPNNRGGFRPRSELARLGPTEAVLPSCPRGHRGLLLVALKEPLDRPGLPKGASYSFYSVRKHTKTPGGGGEGKRCSGGAGLSRRAPFRGEEAGPWASPDNQDAPKQVRCPPKSVD